MYSITSGPSFNHAKDVYKMVTRAKRGKQVCVPGGNKCDKFQEREVAKVCRTESFSKGETVGNVGGRPSRRMDETGRQANIIHRFFVAGSDVFSLIWVRMLIMPEVCEACLLNCTPSINQVFSCDM
jgi:hypothetical protein